MRIWLVLPLVLGAYIGLGQGAGPYDWAGYDAFDEINDMMDRVNPENCMYKSDSELYLPTGALAQMPRFNQLVTQIIYPNRTIPRHVHNMALNRAFFHSYMNYKLNDTEHFHLQPGLMYHYFSAAADISANEYAINGSAIFYDRNLSYTNWYRNLPFNTSLELFGPRAWRLDDYNDPTNWLREPTNRTIDIVDYGAGPQSDYTQTSYKLNQWYRKWLPDGEDEAGRDETRKHNYDVEIRYSNETGKFLHDTFKSFTMFGPPSPGITEKENQPVVWTQPYYDCGRSNKWIVSAVAPIVDRIARYLEWDHIRRNRFVGVSVMDMDFLSVDINPCPLGTGNERPNDFAGTARCKPTTMCEPLFGWGFRRGGYHCMCKPGYRYPLWQEGPFLGTDIESATEDEYNKGFDCLRVYLRQVIPRIDVNQKKKRSVGDDYNENTTMKEPEYFGEFGDRPVELGQKHLPEEERQYFIMKRKQKYLKMMQGEQNHSNATMKLVSKQVHVPKSNQTSKKQKLKPRYQRDSSHVRKKRQAFDLRAFERMEMIINQKEAVSRNKDNCEDMKEDELQLPGDVIYNADVIFAGQAQTALRLSHFLSNFLQNIDVYEEYGNLRGDKFLNVEQLFGEVVANVMGDLRMKGSGIFFDANKYEGPDNEIRQFFGPYAYRADDEDEDTDGDVVGTTFRAIDYAGFPQHYLDKSWFKTVRERWQSNTYGLTKFTEKPMIRSDVDGASLKKFEMYPMYYYAPGIEDGWWSPPYFDCNGYINDWIITYSVPFFGVNSIGTALEFKGVVIADVKLDKMDINQCPMEFYIPNAFKGTARCHFDNTYCEPIPGYEFHRGGYKCECRVGYEYPFDDLTWYIAGHTMESEYEKKMLGLQNRYDTLKCRIAGASTLSQSWLLIVFAVYVSAWIGVKLT